MKRYHLILVLGLFIFISACTPTTQPQQTNSNNTEIVSESAVTQPEASATPELSIQGNCANDYYPVIVGTTWQYEGNGTMAGAFQFSRSITDVSESGFRDQDVWGDGLVRTGTWTCEKGNITALNKGGMATVSLPENPGTPVFVAESTESDGLTIPAKMSIGQSWDQFLKISGNMDITDGISAFVINETGVTCTPEVIESVSVPAGTFDALKINCQSNMAITLDMGTGSNEPIIFVSTSTMWYAEGIGMIKLVDNSEIGETTISLTEYAIPGL